MFIKNVASVFIFFLYTCLFSSYTIQINDLRDKMNRYRTCFVKEHEHSVMKTNVIIKDVSTNIYNNGNHFLHLNFDCGIVYPSNYTIISDISCIEFFDTIQKRIFVASCSKIRYSPQFNLVEFSGNVIIVMNSGERINVDNVIYDLSDGNFYSDSDVIVTKDDNNIMCGQGFVVTSQFDVNIYNVKYHGKNIKI